MKKTPSERANLYNKEHYDRILVILPKGIKQKIKRLSEKKDGGSVNRFIKRAIFETKERDEKNER